MIKLGIRVTILTIDTCGFFFFVVVDSEVDRVCLHLSDGTKCQIEPKTNFLRKLIYLPPMLFGLHVCTFFSF